LVPRTASPIFVHRKKELEQAHLILATPCPPARDTTRFAANLLTSILGGGTSSRLWQTIREERGLAYSVGASVSSFSDVGIFQIYAGTSPDHLDKVIDLSIGELRKIVNTKVTEDELQLVKEQAISSILLGLESSSVRAGTLARQQIIHGRIVPPEETISKFEEVTCEEIQRVANTYFTKFEIACGILGDLNGYKIGRNRLHI
jgi:predicted Zn-dependent peptidase